MNLHDPAQRRQPRLLCIGMPVRDLTFRVKQVPARGAKQSAERFDEVCGGNALNAAIAIARLGGHASLTGPLGDASEPSSATIFEQLAQEGVDGGALVHMPGLVTPLSAVMVDPGGERTIVTFRDPLLWRVELPDANILLSDCDAILIENRCAGFATALCAEARRRGIAVVVDADRLMALDDALLTACSHLIFSSAALHESAGVADDTEALRKIAALTPAFLAVTNGPQGTIWRDDDGHTRHAPAFAVDAVDTLGAGDIFHGAFALAITERQHLETALRFASAAAALKCTRFGGAFAAPTRAEVEALLGGTAPSPSGSQSEPTSRRWREVK